MELKQAVTKLEQSQNIFADLTNYVESMVALQLVAGVQMRIQKSGLNANLTRFSIYSKQYAEKRKKRGFQTAFKDFTFSTEMWRSIKIKRAIQNGGVISVTYGPTTTESTRKVENLSKQENINILLPDKNQVLDLQQDIQTYIEEALKNIINGK